MAQSGYNETIGAMNKVIAFVDSKKALFNPPPEGMLPPDVWVNADKVKRFCLGFVKGHRDITQDSFDDTMGNMAFINHFLIICRILNAAEHISNDDLSSI